MSDALTTQFKTAVSTVESFIERLIDELPGILPGGPVGTGTVDITSEVVAVVLAASIGATQTYTVQRDGFVAGLQSNTGTAWSMSINIDPPSAQIGGAAGVFTGHIYYAPVGSFNDRLAAEGTLRIPIRAGDLLRFKNFAATLTTVVIQLGYPKIDVISTQP